MAADYSAFILSDVKEIDEYLKVLPAHSHIYIANENIDYYHSRVTLVKYGSIRENAMAIYKDMFKRRLGYIFSTDSTKELRNKIDICFSLDKGFMTNGGAILGIFNFWNNLEYTLNSPNSYTIKDIFNGKPLVIVSSGPSLNKNIQILKKYQDKAVIMACGTSIGALKKHGITPHFLVSVDPYPEMMGCIIPSVDKNTTLITTSMADHNLNREFPGEKILLHITEILKVVGGLGILLDITECFHLNVTVTTFALSLAIHMGANPIVFVGQDMCIYDNTYYADGVNGIEEKKTLEIESDGKKFKTTYCYKEVSDYLNEVVPKLESFGKTVINATEGGIGIKGAKDLTLRKTAEKYFIEKIQMPEIKANTMIDKAKILAQISLIKKDIEELIKYTGLFKNYIKNLLENNVPFNFIKIEVDEWFDNLRSKPGYQYLILYVDWIWFLLIVSETKEAKENALNKLSDFLGQLMNLINNQITNLSKRVLQ